jgi:hypothetical protein
VYSGWNSPTFDCCLVTDSYFLFLLSDPEDWGSIFIRNVNKLYTTRRRFLEYNTLFTAIVARTTYFEIRIKWVINIRHECNNIVILTSSRYCVTTSGYISSIRKPVFSGKLRKCEPVSTSREHIDRFQLGTCVGNAGITLSELKNLWAWTWGYRHVIRPHFRCWSTNFICKQFLYCHALGVVTYRRGLDWWPDLLTLIQAIITLSLIYTLYSSPLRTH